VKTGVLPGLDRVLATTRIFLPELSDKLKHAIKVGLSITLAYMIPLAMGWSQPSTTATTVMLIAATGGVSESLMKGTLRVIGTLIGASIGLFLIANFPQDRELYLLLVAITISIILYLYKSFRGDGTVFILSAVMVLMVFNGGDIADSFLYGIDRTWMTIFGVIVYSLVGTFLWPVNVRHDCAGQARQLAALSADLFRLFAEPSVDSQPADETDRQNDSHELITRAVQARATLQSSYDKARSTSEQMAYADVEWRALLFGYDQLMKTLAVGISSPADGHIDYARHISNYAAITGEITDLFDAIDAGWAGRRVDLAEAGTAPVYDRDALMQLPHLQISAVMARGQALGNLYRRLYKLHAYTQYINANGEPVSDDETIPPQPRFVWLDAENFKTALKVFLTYWVAIAVWIYLNPPGGYMYVTFACVLVPLLSFSPLQPKQLVILFTLCFVFAIPSYIFILPQLTLGYELALFLFTYTFVAYYFLQGPLSIFFLLGMFTLGISNTMNYNFGVFLSIVLMFYLAVATLTLSHFFPFSPRAEHLLLLMRRRFFRYAAGLLASAGVDGWSARYRQRIYRGLLTLTIAKLRMWGRLVDLGHFTKTTRDKLVAFSGNCALLNFRLNALIDSGVDFSHNPIVQQAKRLSTGDTYLQTLRSLLNEQSPREVALSEEAVEERLRAFVDTVNIEAYRTVDIAGFYVYLNLHREFHNALMECGRSMRGIDWANLRESRF